MEQTERSKLKVLREEKKGLRNPTKRLERKRRSEKTKQIDKA